MRSHLLGLHQCKAAIITNPAPPRPCPTQAPLTPPAPPPPFFPATSVMVTGGVEPGHGKVLIQHPETGEWGELSDASTRLIEVPHKDRSASQGSTGSSTCTGAGGGWAAEALSSRQQAHGAAVKLSSLVPPCARSRQTPLPAGTVNGLTGFDDASATVACRQSGMGSIGKKLPCKVRSCRPG